MRTPAMVSRAFLAMATSATAVALLQLACAMKRHRRRRRVPLNGKELDIFHKDTPANRRILYGAYDLFTEPWGFPNRHFASIMAQVRPSPFRGPWSYRARRRVEQIPIPDGGELEVEYFEPSGMAQPPPSDTPVVVILHGVNGHSREPYVEQAALHVAIDKGWRAVVLNYAKIRVVNHGGEDGGESDNKAGGATYLRGGSNFTDQGDMNYLISFLRKRHDGFLAAVGYSMGGAKLLQYLIRTKEHCNIDAACAISSPLDFTQRNATVYNPVTLEARGYHFIITAALKLGLLRNYRELVKHHRLAVSKPFRRTKSGLMWWLNTHTVSDFDAAVTVPAKDYPSLDHYYGDASAAHRMKEDVTIPFLCITARNDPFVPHDIIPGEDVTVENENIFIVNTKEVGGHVGYWLPGRGCWATRGCLSFFDSVISNTRFQRRSRLLRKHSSIQAARNLKKSSTTQLTDYSKFVAFDSNPDMNWTDDTISQGGDDDDDVGPEATTTTADVSIKNDQQRHPPRRGSKNGQRRSRSREESRMLVAQCEKNPTETDVGGAANLAAGVDLVMQYTPDGRGGGEDRQDDDDGSQAPRPLESRVPSFCSSTCSMDSSMNVGIPLY